MRNLSMDESEGKFRPALEDNASFPRSPTLQRKASSGVTIL